MIIQSIYRFQLLLIAFVTFLTSTNVTAHSESRAFLSMTIIDFRKLSPAEQKTIVASAIEHRLQHARNIYFESLQRGGMYEFADGKVGKRYADLNGMNVSLWRVDDSTREDTVRGGVNVEKSRQKVSFHYDAKSGIGRGFVKTTQTDPRVFGRIDRGRDTLSKSNDYVYWLDGEHNNQGEFIIRYLADHKSEFTIDSTDDNGLIRLTVPWHPIWPSNAIGTREFTLDPEKGFLPVKGVAFWKGQGEFDKQWRREYFTVEESKLVKDVWMPTKLQTITTGPPLGEGRVAVIDITVPKISAGDVTENDLQVTFPVGTEVTDVIMDKAYTIADESGKKIKVRPLVHTLPPKEEQPTPEPPVAKSPAPDKNNSSFLIWTVGGLGVILLVCYRVWTRKRA